MRIISGKYKGRKIELLKEAEKRIRPTSDFAREAIFNILTHGDIGKKYSFVGKNVLDMFCGTGAFGIEALSRGAGEVTFVDESREAINNARHNVKLIGELENVDFVQASAERIGQARNSYSLIFLDPPYFKNMIPQALMALYNGGWVSDNSLLVIERDDKEKVKIPDIFEVLDKRKYGRAAVELLKLV
ncbi:MAG: 16S rRNA (guanine(966)-N(2))-methyltransferase RsmD [Rickettsiales bacterium]